MVVTGFLCGARLALAALFITASILIPAGSAAGSDLSQTTKDQIEQTVDEYLTAHPEILLKALDLLREKSRTAEADAGRSRLSEVRNDLQSDIPKTFAGNPDGDITIIEFFDYRCGYCRKAHPVVARLISADPGIKVIYRDFPILGDMSVEAAKASLAAARQDKFLPLHNALMEVESGLDSDKILQLADNLGIDTERLIRDMESDLVADQISKNHSLARHLGIRGTPAFVIGKNIAPGFLEYSDMQKLVAEARSTQTQ